MSANNHKQNARMQAVTRHPKATDTKLTRFVLSSSLQPAPSVSNTKTECLSVRCKNLLTKTEKSVKMQIGRSLGPKNVCGGKNDSSWYR